MDLLGKVLKLPTYIHFRKIGEDDWRDSREENPSFSLSSKGWSDHRTGKSGTLNSLLNIDISGIYSKSTMTPTDIDIIKQYYNTRDIDISESIIADLGMRVNRHRDEMSIITPMKGVDGSLVQLHVIKLNRSFEKIGKSKYLGKASKDRGILLKIEKDRFEKDRFENLIIVEGLEDAIVLRQHGVDAEIIVSGTAVSYKMVRGFFSLYNSVTQILDHDETDNSLKHSYHLGDIKRLRPRDIKIDANEAHIQGWLGEWFDTLVDVPFEDVKQIYEKNPVGSSGTSDDIVDRFNKKHALIMIKGKVNVLNIDDDFSLSSKQDFLTWYQNDYVTVETDAGSKRKKSAEYWLNSSNRRQYKGFEMNPKVNGHKSDKFNLWQGFAVEPVKGNCDLYYQHIYDVVAQGDNAIYEYMLNWMADAIQNPTKKSGVCMVLRGGQGAGKGTVISNFCKLYGFGRHALHVSNPQHVVGNFNGHLKNCLILFADEAFFAGNKQHEGILKHLVTESQTIIEMKGKEAFSVESYLRVIMASNKTWVAPLDHDDRRYFIQDVVDAKKLDYGYFSAIDAQMKNGGLQALLYDLQNRDLSNVDIRDYPNTSAIRDNKLDSLDSVGSFIYDMLILEEIPSELSIGDIYQRYKDHRPNKYQVSLNSFARTLRQYFPNLKTKRVGSQPRTYIFSKDNSLEECRKLFENKLGSPIRWSSEKRWLSETQE
jgi:hypothetical protein